MESKTAWQVRALTILWILDIATLVSSWFFWNLTLLGGYAIIAALPLGILGMIYGGITRKKTNIDAKTQEHANGFWALGIIIVVISILLFLITRPLAGLT